MKGMIRRLGAALLLCAVSTAVPVGPTAGATGESPATREIRDIKGPLPPATLFPWLLPVGTAVLLTGTALLVMTWRRGRRHRSPLLSSLPSPEAALDLLVKRFAGGEDEISLLYAELSALVRIFLEERTGLPAPRMTTEELLLGISANGGTLPEEVDRLRSFLLRCDLVKFAGATPGRAGMREDLAAARAIIRATGRESSPTRH